MPNNGVLIHGHALGLKMFSQGMSNVGTPRNVVVVDVRKYTKHYSLQPFKGPASAKGKKHSVQMVVVFIEVFQQ